jgi:hypothetical protein
MARPLRVEFPNANYHVMTRGNGRQAIFHGEDDYQRLTDGLATTVGRTGWQVMAYEEILRAWQGEMGGSNSNKAYCRYVESGMQDDLPNPLREAREGWLLGSEAFVEQIKGLLNKPELLDQVPQARSLARPEAARYRIRSKPQNGFIKNV